MEVEAFWETELERQLIQACRTVPPNIENIETLLRQGADLNSRNMHRTVFTGILESYGVALDDGFGMDGTVGGLYLPAIVSLLLKHGADPNLSDEAGQIWPLDEMIWCAADNDSLHAAELLQRYGARKWEWDHSPVILHIPHSSMIIPKKAMNELLPSAADISKELHDITDHWVDELFSFPEFSRKIVYPFSRMLCDVERFRDDALEPMSHKGMGAVYTALSNGEKLRHLTISEREQMLREFYDPHHEALSQLVDDVLTEHQRCVVVDAHSFSSRPLPHEPDQEPDRPDFCIGTDEFHTPPELTDQLVETIRQAGWTVEVNRPFNGSMVPSKHYRLEPRVHSVMIEINRKIYMGEILTCQNEHFNDVKQLVFKLLEQVRAQCMPAS